MTEATMRLNERKMEVQLAVAYSLNDPLHFMVPKQLVKVVENLNREDLVWVGGVPSGRSQFRQNGRLTLFRRNKLFALLV